MTPLIGIPCHLRSYDDKNQLHGVKETYINALEAAGAATCLIPLRLSESSLRAVYQRCDGIFLAGGGDVDPSFYGEKPHESLGGVCADRDRCEIALSKWCLADKKPLLAVCRGIQVLNVALGGTLYQDLPSQTESDEEHRLDSHSGHDLRLEDNSRLADILGQKELLVNSRHHQAVKNLSSQLKCVGYSADGIVEAVEVKGDQFMFGLQCHPEDLCVGPAPEWLRLFKAFVQACNSAKC